MGKKNDDRPFHIRHMFGWLLSIATIVSAAAADLFYRAFRAPLEAQVAARQANDSVTDFVLHQQMSYNDMVFTLIWGIAAVVIVLLLIPTFIDLIKTGGE